MRQLATSFLIITFFLGATSLSTGAAIIPNDPYYQNQWYLQKINANVAWERINSSPNITIAVIDTGVQIDHPDLQDNIWFNRQEIAGNDLDDDKNGFIDDVNGWDFVANLPDPSPKFDTDWTESGVAHGTMVAGIIAAVGNNNLGVTGVTWRAKIMPLRVLNDRGEGRIGDVVRAIDYAINNGADIINLSFVGFTFSETLQTAIKRASDFGVIIVAAAGNEQTEGEGYNTDETPIYPVCHGVDNPLVIGVAATDPLDQKTSFSSYGFRCIDITAPGVSFFNTITQGSNVDEPQLLYDGYWSGTSMATPVISGTLALIAEINPNLSPVEIVNVLFKTTDNISLLNPNYLGQLGAGRVNVGRAIETARELLYNHLGRLLLAPASGEQSIVLTDKSGHKLTDWVIKDAFNHGANVAAGDISGNGESEIIVAAGQGAAPEIKIYNRQGKLIGRFFAYHPNFRGGLTVAVADLDGDGQAEIITGAGPGGGPHVRIFNQRGQLKGQFFATSNDFRGGVNVAAGNIDDKGGSKIIIGLGAGSDPAVKIFDRHSNLLGVFLAYDKSFRGGVKVTVGNIDGRVDRKHEIITAPGVGHEPLLKIFSNRGELKKNFLVFNRNWQSGFSLSAGDLDNNGLADIVVGAQAGGDPQVRVFSGRGELLESFYAWEGDYSGGVNVSVVHLLN